MTRRRRDPSSWFVVRLPERDLAESILALAAPLLEALGPERPADAVRRTIELVVVFWNASVAASAFWGDPRRKALNKLREQMRAGRLAPHDSATFDLLSDAWRGRFARDPRLVESWSYDADESGAMRLVCAMGLPEGVQAEEPPPLEKRVSIGGRFLDETRIELRPGSYLSFPVDRHRGVVGAGRAATVHVMMPTALQLFAEGRLPRIGGEPVEVAIGSRQLGPMVLAEVRCGGDDGVYDVAVLLFKSAGGGADP